MIFGKMHYIYLLQCIDASHLTCKSLISFRSKILILPKCMIRRYFESKLSSNQHNNAEIYLYSLLSSGNTVSFGYLIRQRGRPSPCYSIDFRRWRNVLRPLQCRSFRKASLLKILTKTNYEWKPMDIVIDTSVTLKQIYNAHPKLTMKNSFSKVSADSILESRWTESPIYTLI